MAVKKNLQKGGGGLRMRQVVAAALALLLTLFLLPLLLLGEGEAPEEIPTGTLPIDRTVVTPGVTADSRVSVKVQVGEGEVLTLSMDKYLWRVVAAEMPASFEPEALKAQTVAARTYTLSKLARTSEKHPDADVCTDITCCQAYITPEEAAVNWGDNARAYTDKIAAAVADTDGLAALWQGQPIQALFFSSAAGKTVDAVEVWGNSVPYLTSVDSPEGEEVPNYHTTVTVPVEEFRAKLLEQYPEVLEERDELWNAGRLDQPMFDPARQFAAADRIVIAAPFWDLCFPAILKIYLERISVTDITFGYDEQGAMVGLCRASKLLLITTRGGNYAGTELEMGTPLLKALCVMYGIPQFVCLDAEGLDDVRSDKAAILADAERRADALAEEF